MPQEPLFSPPAETSGEGPVMASPHQDPGSAPEMAGAIAVQVNGDRKACPTGLDLAAFLVSLGVKPQLVAVEYNGEILQRQVWATTQLQEGDRLEIVTIVGGG